MGRVCPVAFVVLAAVSIACGGDDAKTATSGAAVPAPARVRTPPRAPTRATPRVVSITPSTVDIRDGRLAGGSYSVEYEIANPELVERAEIVIYAPGVGQVQRVSVSPRERDIVTFDLDTTGDFGPTIALRAQCPGTESDWYILGTKRAPYGTEVPAGLHITGVSPDYINLDRALVAGNGDLAAGAGVPVTMSGSLITPECTPSATVNGSEVELKNVYAQRGQIRSLLLYRDFYNRYVSSRYLEVKLSLHGAGFAVANIGYIEFVE
jgi:hypothetical protein